MLLDKVTAIICVAILSLGILGAGYSVGKNFYLAKKLNRTVTIKGLAERDVRSDLGIWEINYREIGNDLMQLNQKLLHDQEIVVAFLKQQGFKEEEIDRTSLKVEDRLANIYSNQSNNQNEQRYVVSSGTRVRSENVELIQKTAQIMDQLLQQGVPLAFDLGSVSPNPSFYYIKLDAIRPAMLAEATKSARIVAEQFAKDTDSDLAGIQRASQGVFQIMGRDTSTMNADWNSNQNALGSIEKKVRLVTTIDYRLK